MGYKVDIITKSEHLPLLDESDFFHSSELFRIQEKVSGMMPYMVVVSSDEGKVLSHMLATLRRRGVWFPPYLFSQGRVYGEGVYADGVDREELFSMMLEGITKIFHKRMCLYVEFSNLSRKMFGYRAFRTNGYFPVAWMNIHNSLHSVEPELRLDEKDLQVLGKSREAGVSTRQTLDSKDIHAFYKLLKSYYRFRPQRYVPAERFFHELVKSEKGIVHVTEYKGRIVGGTALAYSLNDAFLWFETYRKKRYPLLNIDFITVWHAIRQAFDMKRNHIYFLNVGLPFSKSHYRDFILKFGGKPVSTFRWFHFTFGWINRILSWVYSF